MDETQVECKKRLSKDTCSVVDIKKKRVLALHVTSEQVHDGKKYFPN